jgi:CDP-diacylglycerol--serine O-phosphatidyltransferase
MIPRMSQRATPVVAAHPSASPAAPRRLRRGAAILPSLFTTGNLFLGFWAVILSFHGDYQKAAPLVFGAIVLDLLDGRIARLTNTTSEFGGELDSLADVISFGVAPGVLAYAWGFSTMPKVGWLVAFLFVMCGTLRLARFNVQKSVVDGRYFVGLPIPAAAAMVAALVNFAPARLEVKATATVVAALLIVLAFLMVSTFRYLSFKKVDLRRRRSYVSILGIALFIALVAMHTEWMLLGMATLYWLSGPLAYVWGVVRRRPETAPPVPAGAP